MGALRTGFWLSSSESGSLDKGGGVAGTGGSDGRGGSFEPVLRTLLRLKLGLGRSSCEFSTCDEISLSADDPAASLRDVESKEPTGLDSVSIGTGQSESTTTIADDLYRAHP